MGILAARRMAALPLLAMLAALFAVAAPPAQASSNAEAVAESTLFNEHNRARSNPGAYGYGSVGSTPKLSWAEDVAEVARAWSEQMAREGVMYHNPNFTTETCCWTSIGENVAWVAPVAYWGSPEAAAKQLFQNWMDSDGHRNNITDGRYSQVGIGVTIDGNDRMWATAVFRAPDGSASGGATSPDDGLLFPDVPLSHTFHDDIVWMAESGITNGYSNGLYGPADRVTRGQMAAFMYRLESPSGSFPNPRFSDVPTSHPFFTEIAWMAQSGVTKGYGDGTFGPSDRVTRGQMAAFMHRLDGAPGGPFPNPRFSDVPSHHPFFDEIAWMAQSGVTTGYRDGTFRPGDSVTRGHMAGFMHRYATR
jgi:uncharacterized protein YkwD